MKGIILIIYVYVSSNVVGTRGLPTEVERDEKAGEEEDDPCQMVSSHYRKTIPRVSAG